MPGADVAKRIRLIRQRRGLTQWQFGKAVEVSRLSVARYEGGRLPRADVLDRIARLGGVTVTWLLHGAEEAELLRFEAAGPSEMTGTAAETLGDALSGRLAAQLSRLPRKYRERYDKRVRELVVRLRGELEEYVGLLRAQYIARRRRRRR